VSFDPPLSWEASMHHIFHKIPPMTHPNWLRFSLTVSLFI
jgi:hypothetical protein